MPVSGDKTVRIFCGAFCIAVFSTAIILLCNWYEKVEGEPTTCEVVQYVDTSESLGDLNALLRDGYIVKDDMHQYRRQVSVLKSVPCDEYRNPYAVLH